MARNSENNLSRRQALRLSAGAAAFACAGLSSPLLAAPGETRKLISDFARGNTPIAGKITLAMEETAENGNIVPVSISVESAMIGNEFVEEIVLIAEENPRPMVATFRFGAMAGKASVATRIRLARTQTVTALARMRDGSVFVDAKQVNVVIAGCGGEG